MDSLYSGFRKKKTTVTFNKSQRLILSSFSYLRKFLFKAFNVSAANMWLLMSITMRFISLYKYLGFFSARKRILFTRKIRHGLARRSYAPRPMVLVHPMRSFFFYKLHDVTLFLTGF